jgi:hypothetical protein
MSHVISNLRYEGKPFELTEDEVKRMSVAEFDKLLLSDQVAVYNRYPSEYARLTGRTEDTTTEDTRTDAEKFCDTFEARIDRAISRAFHGENQ